MGEVEQRLVQPSVFDLEADEVSVIFSERLDLLERLAELEDGEVGDLLDGQVEVTPSLDEEILSTWDEDRDTHRQFPTSWYWHRLRGGTVVVDGSEMSVEEWSARSRQASELLAIKCDAPHLADGPVQDTSEEPPGGLLMFLQADDEYAPTTLHVVSPRGAAPLRDLPPPDGWAPGGMMTTTPDGNLLTFAHRDGLNGLVVVDREGRLVRTVYAGEGSLVCPAMSPDGSTVVALDQSDEDNAVVSLIGPDGQPRPLDLPFESIGCADFVSPDRLVIDHTRESVDEGHGVWLVGTDGSDHQLVYEPEGCNFSSGGVDAERTRAAVSVSCPGVLDDGLWVVDLSTGDASHIVSGHVGAPEWSPDGTWLAFGFTPLGETSHENTAVWVVREDGEGLQEVTEPYSFLPAWLPPFPATPGTGNSPSIG